jgi:membrane fusion protein, multidrug efflux system
MFALLAGGAFAFMLPPGQAAPSPPSTAPAVPVVAAKVVRHDVPIYLRGIGTVIAFNTVLVRSQIQGQIVKIAFKEGQTVHAGDLLAQIDPRPYEAQLDQMIATRDRDRTQLSNALDNLSRYTKLRKDGWATPQLVETQSAQVGQLRNAIKADEALIKASRVQLGYTRLTAPINGVLGIRQVDIGNIIHPTDPLGLVVVTQLQPISVVFTLPQTELPKIQQQMEKGPLETAAYSTDDEIKLDDGKLAVLNNQVNQQTGTLQLKAEFPNEAHRLWPGELINVWLLLETRKDGLTVPASTVQQGPNGSYVYVIGPDNQVQSRPVSVEQISDGQALIRSGLKANETVVVDGQYRLQPGALAQVLHGKAAQEADLQSSIEQAIP